MTCVRPWPGPENWGSCPESVSPTVVRFLLLALLGGMTSTADTLVLEQLWRTGFRRVAVGWRASATRYDTTPVAG